MANQPKPKDITYDNQRRRIEKLMEDPDKLVDLPDTSMSLSKKYEPPEFVRNVMGSSAGAGSGEFHVYRHLRRKELTRLKELEASMTQEELDLKFKTEMEEMKRKADERTAKKRSKRLKKKVKSKVKAGQKAASTSEAPQTPAQTH